MPPAAFYRALYMTLWRLNERHDLRASAKRFIALVGEYPAKATTDAQAYRHAAWFALKCGLLTLGFIHLVHLGIEVAL